MQVIADHARALAFAVADGGRPGNDGRGYVLRRILRRAARHGRRLGFDEPFLWRGAEQVIEMMGGHYRSCIEAPGPRAAGDPHRGGALQRDPGPRVCSASPSSQRAARERGDKLMRGEEAFMLHDTFGFPLDLTQVMAEEKGLERGRGGLPGARWRTSASARRQGSRSRPRPRCGMALVRAGNPARIARPPRFGGYESWRTTADSLGIRPLDDELCELVIDPTPFYAESGGQVGDRGRIEGEGLRPRGDGHPDLRRADRCAGAGARG